MNCRHDLVRKPLTKGAERLPGAGRKTKETCSGRSRSRRDSRERGGDSPPGWRVRPRGPHRRRRRSSASDFAAPRGTRPRARRGLPTPSRPRRACRSASSWSYSRTSPIQMIEPGAGILERAPTAPRPARIAIAHRHDEHEHDEEAGEEETPGRSREAVGAPRSARGSRARAGARSRRSRWDGEGNWTRLTSAAAAEQETLRRPPAPTASLPAKPPGQAGRRSHGIRWRIQSRSSL